MFGISARMKDSINYHYIFNYSKHDNIREFL